MFCPLSQREFPEGVSECSECHLPLVATQEESAERRTELWSGDFQRSLDKLLPALDAANIPCFAEERFSSTLPAGLGENIIPTPPRLEFIVWVLREDATRAEEVLAKLDQANNPDAAVGGGK
jgi:hypothetical protein